jgi:hypothetical protein
MLHVYLHEFLINILKHNWLEDILFQEATVMNMLESIKLRLRPGQVYRRSDFEKWSRSVDRDLRGLVKDGALVKVRQGLYQCPARSRFGLLPASPDKLVRTFLKDDDFLLTSPNDYNALGLGTTQLYNFLVVYNHKRHGRFELGGQIFDFRRKPRYPKKATTEFLLVDLVNNLEQLAEDRPAILVKLQAKLPEMDSKRLRSAIKLFAKVSTRKFFETALGNAT